MFANNIEEFCTIAGDIVTPIGKTPDSILFSEKYVNLSKVPYIIEDANSDIIVGGEGTYNTNGTITRNDTWTWNGTSYVDIPGSNLLLAGGSYIIRVAPSAINMDNWNAAYSWGDHALVGYSTTDTVYDDTALAALVATNTAKVTDLVHPLVETAVPSGALFTDTVYNDTTIQAAVTLNTAKISNVVHPLVQTAVPVDAVFTDTDYGDHSGVGYELTANKGNPNGYVPLNGSTLIPSEKEKTPG